MRRFLTIIVILFIATSAYADDYRYWFGGGAGLTQPAGGKDFSFKMGMAYGAVVGHRINDRWLVELNGSLINSKEEDVISSPADTLLPMGGLRGELKGIRVGALVSHTFRPAWSRFNFAIGFGGGLLDWKVVDEFNDTTLRVEGNRGQEIEYSASELFATAGLKLMLFPSKTVSFQFTGTADYLTGAGAEFAAPVNDARDRWLLSGMLTFNLHFGGGRPKEDWASDSSWQQPDGPSRPGKLASVDSDGDGISEDQDKCLGTPRGVEVDRSGCPRDSDGDGVADGLDDCPATEPAARGKIDIFGCPVDSDFDGIPDYKDNCPTNPVGAQVDVAGCPLDADKDGVPDGLDDCPTTLIGIPVDKYGCMDLSIFSKPMILHPDYEPGGFEIDSRTKSKIEALARALALVPDIRLEIVGYTDDIGVDGANQKLSEKRANRIRDYLVVYGVLGDRISTVGRGESNFVASNQTAEGRAKNRRIEIIFHK
ncbi:MAG: OmpA family protein [bacterium]|nr:OmpA family protein [bacterium]